MVPRPRASPSRTAASSPGGDARSRTGGRGGGGNGGIAGIGGIGDNMLRGVELRLQLILERGRKPVFGICSDNYQC